MFATDTGFVNGTYSIAPIAFEERGAVDVGVTTRHAHGRELLMRRWLPPVLAALAVEGCHQDDDRPRYRTVASGDYVDVVQSDELVGDVCPAAAAEVDRQMEELAATFGVSIPEDYRVLARIEASIEGVEANCDLDDVNACFYRGGGEHPPLMTSPFYLSPHEVVHAVQALRGGWPHVALLEGEARIFQGSVHTSYATFACSGMSRDEAALREALEDRSLVGVYTVYQEIVARVYDTYGREGFDALWAASADDPSTEALLRAFEDLFGLTLFELMEQPSATCQDVRPGCVGLEERSLTTDGLTLEVPQACGPGVLGLETPADAASPGSLERSFLLEIEEPGDVTISFSGPGGGELALAACGGFDTIQGSVDPVIPVRYAKENTNGAGTPRSFRFEAGKYRLIVGGLANDQPAMAHLDLAPLDE